MTSDDSSPTAALVDRVTPTAYFEGRLAHETDCADVFARMASGDPNLVVVDARAAHDHDARRLPGAISLPHRALDEAALERFVPEAEFVTYCWGPHCNGATKAAARIAALGRPVREMLGGMWGWEQEGYAFEGRAVPRHRVGLLCFEGMDLMDFAGPYEVFHTASRLCARSGEQLPFEVLTIGVAGAAYGGVGVTPQLLATEAPPLDVLVVPGAVDLDGTSPDASLRRLAERAEILASVCTGAFYLERTGLLGPGPATTHWEDLAELAAKRAASGDDQRGPIRGDVRWCDNGRVITAGGLSSGIAMALHLVDRLVDRELAERVARQIDYVWTEER